MSTDTNGERQRRPVILTVDDEPAVLAAVARDLRRGFGERYRIMRSGSGQEALDLLKELRTRGDQVALLVADQKMPGLSGTEYLVEARKVVPEAKRVLLTAYADTEAAISAINDVALDYYLLKPWDPPEEQLYPVVEDLLTTWDAGAALAAARPGSRAASRTTSASPPVSAAPTSRAAPPTRHAASERSSSRCATPPRSGPRAPAASSSSRVAARSARTASSSPRASPTGNWT